MPDDAALPGFSRIFCSQLANTMLAKCARMVLVHAWCSTRRKLQQAGSLPDIPEHNAVAHKCQNRLLQQCSEMRETKLWANQVLSWARRKGPYEM